MKNNESIAQIKLNLSTKDSLDDPYYLLLKKDTRQGVQKLCEQFEKRLKKAAQLKENYQQMTIFEKEAYQAGYRLIAGIDEVGRGPLAGPVVAAAVILPENAEILGLNDSKQLSEKKRNEFVKEIKKQAIAYAIGQVDSEEIDSINIYEASKKAMCLAIEQLEMKPDYLLIDAMTLDLPIAQEKIIKGDARSVSIAAASILAKVYRDDLMRKYHIEYPQYGFDKNAGYGTKEHLIALETNGVTPIHRKSYAPVEKILSKP